jgi:hypothetical protein
MKTMKTTIRIAAGLALSALFAGCVATSVYPFYTAKDVIFEPALVGTWGEPGSTNATNEQWRFEKAEGQAYKLTVQEKEKPSEFDTCLFKLKGVLFLDLCPRERPDNSLPLHYLLKVNRLGPSLEVSLLDYDWLTKLIEKNPRAVRHIIVPKKLGESDGGNLVLTADTAELQKFIVKHMNSEEAFGKSQVLERRAH